jgi:transcriptional regulator with XRE-family HTH domain
VPRRSVRPKLTPAQQSGSFFRTTREAQNLSQEQLAALTGRRAGRVSRAMISAVERGRHLPGLEVLLTLSQVLHVSPSEVLERLELARAEPVGIDGLTLDELDREAGRSFWAGEPRRAAACYDAMLRLLREDPLDEEADQERRVATTEMRRGAALRRCGAAAAARSSIERAITLSDSMPEIQAQAYLVLAALLVQLGRLPLARDAAERAVRIAGALGDVKLRGWCWIEQGEVLSASGDHAGAREAFLRARQHVRAAGDFHHAIKVEGNIGHCLHELGRHEQARRRYVGAIALARRHKVPASEALWLVALGRLALDRGKPHEADACALAAARIAKPREDWLTCFRAEWLRHVVHRQTRPGESDRHRVAYLKRLYVKLEEHRGVEEIRQFKRMYCESPARRDA